MNGNSDQVTAFAERMARMLGRRTAIAGKTRRIGELIAEIEAGGAAMEAMPQWRVIRRHREGQRLLGLVEELEALYEDRGRLLADEVTEVLADQMKDRGAPQYLIDVMLAGRDTEIWIGDLKGLHGEHRAP